MSYLTKTLIAYSLDKQEVFRPAKRPILTAKRDDPFCCSFADIGYSRKLCYRCGIYVDRVRIYVVLLRRYRNLCRTGADQNDLNSYDDNRKNFVTIGNTHLIKKVVITAAFVCKMLEVPVLQRLERINIGEISRFSTISVEKLLRLVKKPSVILELPSGEYHSNFPFRKDPADPRKPFEGQASLGAAVHIADITFANHCIQNSAASVTDPEVSLQKRCHPRFALTAFQSVPESGSLRPGSSPPSSISSSPWLSSCHIPACPVFDVIDYFRDLFSST